MVSMSSGSLFNEGVVHPWTSLLRRCQDFFEEFSRFIDEYIYISIDVLIRICFNAMFSMKQILFMHLVVFFFLKSVKLNVSYSYATA